MTWQEELRKLDEDFSSGQISADEYRTRRDQVLSSAVAPGTAQPDQGGQSGNAESTQMISPASPPQGTPMPPQQQPGPPADATQVVRHDPASDQTQAVPHWQTQQPPQYNPHSPAGGFPQQQQGPPSHPGGFPQQQPAWNAPEQDVSPPWGGGEFPPIAPPGDADWIKQGPENFDDFSEKSGGKTGKIVGVVLTVLLLVGIGFGAWWLLGNDSSSTAGGGSPTETTTTAPSPTTTTPPPEPEKLPVAELEGTAEPYDAIESFAQVKDLNYLTDDEFTAYKKADAGEANFHVQNLPSGSRAVLLLTEVTDGDDAEKAVKKLRDIQVKNGAKKAKDAPKGIFVTEFTNSSDKSAQIRVHYVAENAIVRLEIRSSEGLDEARADYDTVLNAQLDVLPADV